MATMRMSCLCGKVECEAIGTPIVTVACYCDDCQRGSRQIDALPHAAPVLDADGGTAYVLYRRDRFACVKGREFLQDLRLRERSPTRRVIAACCNSAMYLDFEKGHWMCVYRARFADTTPPIQMRMQTRFKPEPDTDSAAADIPTYRAFAPMFFVKLIAARIAMFVS